MGKEIERKFLVRNDGWRDAVESTSFLRQGYLTVDKERTVRVRVHVRERDEKAVLTIKGETVGASRPEFEYEIPKDEANEILSLCLEPVIEKKRHLLSSGGHSWEVDEFEGANEGLVVAEVELDSEDEDVSLPDWAGDEVTEDPRFYNANLVARPFTTW